MDGSNHIAIKLLRQSLLGICLVYCLLSRQSHATLDNQPQSTSISLQEIFEYTKHGYQNYLVPQDTTSLQIDAWGASGADVATSLGDLGNFISTNISVNPGQTLFIYIGKRGTRNNQTLVGGEDGEATDVRLQQDNMDSRIVVAGGGRGAGIFSWSIGRVGNGISIGKASTVFGEHIPTASSSSSYTTGRQLYSQEGVRRGDGKVVIRRHQGRRFLQTIPQHKVFEPSVVQATPSISPSPEPSVRPTVPPTFNPTTFYPTIKPTVKPTLFPTLKPTMIPTQQPTSRPTRCPSTQPTRQPVNVPTAQPSRQPVMRPTSQPTHQPSNKPTRQPTRQPSSQPSRQPSRQPTSQPSR